MADRDAKKVERQLDRISAGLPSGVGGFLRWLRSPLSRWVRIPAGLLLIIGGVVGFVGVGILDGAAWRPAACAGPPLPPTAGNENVSNGRVRGHVYRGTGILNNGPGAFGNTLSPNGQEKLMASRTGASWEKTRGSESCRNSPPNRFGRCPLWVISRHNGPLAPCPLYPR